MPNWPQSWSLSVSALRDQPEALERPARQVGQGASRYCLDPVQLPTVGDIVYLGTRTSADEVQVDVFCVLIPIDHQDTATYRDSIPGYA